MARPAAKPRSDAGVDGIGLPYLKSSSVMDDIVRIPVPLPHIGSVNTWLLRGDPLTLVDTGPRDDEALAALEAGLRRAGVRVEDIELVLHHPPPPRPHRPGRHDRAPLRRAHRRAGPRRRLRRSATRSATAADRRFSLALMRHHGVPDEVIADNEGFWDFIRGTSAAYHTDVRLPTATRSAPAAATCASWRGPGHSTTDALFVDDATAWPSSATTCSAGISSNTEIYPAVEPDGTRPRARVEYLESLRRTAAMPLDRLLTGHGDESPLTRELVRRRFGEHRRRCDRIVEALRDGPRDRVRDRRRTCGRSAPSPSSRCSSSGRCSGTSTCCSTPGAVSEHVDRRRQSRYGVADVRARRHDRPPTRLQEVAVLHEPADTLTRVPSADDVRDLFDLSGRVAVSPAARAGSGSRWRAAFAQAGAEVVVVSRKAEACEEVVAALRAGGRQGRGLRLPRRALGRARRARRGRLPRLRARRRARQQRGRLADVRASSATSPRSCSTRSSPSTSRARSASPRWSASGWWPAAAGSIINVSSTGAVRPTRDIVPYAAAKAGVNAMTVGLAHAFGPTVRVNAIMPGPFLTTISRAWDMDLFAERARTFPLRRAGRGGRDRRRRAVPGERRLELHDGHDPHRRRRRAVEHGGHGRRRSAKST